MTTTSSRPAAAAAALTDSFEGTFAKRHLGPRGADLAAMLRAVGVSSLDELADQTVPTAIRRGAMAGLSGVPAGTTESQALAELRAIAAQNRVFRSFIGMGYHGTITPPPILRNILENPLWYTPYTPYQAEISQGRLEALLNFQTMVSDLTALPLANASLLDEATAAAEAMAMCKAIAGAKKNVFIIDGNAHPQTIAVMQTRAESLRIDVQVGRAGHFEDLLPTDGTFGVLIQYPGSDGRIPERDALHDVVRDTHERGGLVVAACDILALTLITPPGEWASGGADIAVGSTQRFGVPMGYGGPHAAYMATKPEYSRKMPGRVVGVSKDAHGNPAYRLALQTREQHIRREKATSNICTAQVLLAVIASMYAVYHGPEGLKRIAKQVHDRTRVLAQVLQKCKHSIVHPEFFDTIRVKVNGDAQVILDRARQKQMNLRDFGDGTVGISLDEFNAEDAILALPAVFDNVPVTREDLKARRIHKHGQTWPQYLAEMIAAAPESIPPSAIRHSPFLQHPVFNSHHHEHELLRYITKLQRKDISLADSMIPLGSCTMKLNAAAEMIPITWPEFANLHPYAPREQAQGYAKLFADLEQWLAACTGFDAVSLQPNAGSQGEYAGLLAIRAYHRANGQEQRDACLIPTSAHGTNPASAVVAGMHVVAVECDANGNVDVADLRRKAEQHADRLACLMVTYPSTHGVFEAPIKDACAIVHEHGGQVYMDGANMNAQVGLTSPGDIGADVCHLNLHKTFCIPHGGGGPGMGPIAVRAHLAPYLPSTATEMSNGERRMTKETASGDSSPVRHSPTVSAAPWGSALILPIPWMYIRMMGGDGLTAATQVAILNANYMAERLKDHYPVLYRGQNGRVAHEFIIDCRQFEKTSGIRVEDIAKRLMDYGFHAPTMSFPVPGTLMIEPTESEPKAELDRLCDALIAIRAEIDAVESGQLHREDNPLKNAPHTAEHVTSDDWRHPYARQQAAYPLPWVRDGKFWPSVGRIDNAYGDRNLICTCPSVEEMAGTPA